MRVLESIVIFRLVSRDVQYANGMRSEPASGLRPPHDIVNRYLRGMRLAVTYERSLTILTARSPDGQPPASAATRGYQRAPRRR